jgi:hypothetical protein
MSKRSGKANDEKVSVQTRHSLATELRSASAAWAANSARTLVERLESTEQARELKNVLCASCYENLLAWLVGEPASLWTPCQTCAPRLKAWIEKRRKDESP